MSCRNLLAAAITLGCLASCGKDPEFLPDLPPALADEGAYGVTGLRRLTRFEVLNSVGDVFGVEATDLESMLPEDITGTNPFDNGYRAQTVSPLVVGAYDAFAEAYAAKLAAQPDLPQQLGGCTPVAPDDGACFRAIAERVGRRMFRRPLTGAELDTYAAAILPHAMMEGQFATAVEMLGLLFVQHPEFLYRLEHGDGVLTDYEIATRMAYLIWASAPDDALLDQAKDGKLADETARVAQAERMLDDPRARRNWHRFHALWLGFSSAPLPSTLGADLLEETNHLVDRVVFELDADWLSIFHWDETYITPQLATHYGLPPVSAPAWVSYPAGRGGGVLTHGSFLSLGAKFGDTSPTVRGYEIYKRVTCGKLGTIPTSVDTNQPPGFPTDCKPDRYTMSQTPGCDSCHTITDNIGFGLENFGVFGQWRTTEPNNPQCTIEAKGTWNGSAYAGPEQLGQLLADDPRVSACAITQLYRYMTGRDESADDANTLQLLDEQYHADPSLKSMVITLVRSPAFAFRKGE